MPSIATSSLRRDLLSAYLASGAKVASWIVVSALVFRLLGAEAFALLALIRATIGILNYTSVGLSPAMISLVAAARREARPSFLERTDSIAWPNTVSRRDPLSGIYSNALVLAALSAAGGMGLVFLYALAFPGLLNVPGSLQLEREVTGIVVGMGAGVLFRLMADSPGAAIQTTGRVWLDNCLAAATEVTWVLLSAAYLHFDQNLGVVAAAYGHSGAVFAICRWLVAGTFTGVVWPRWSLIELRVLGQLLGFGSLVVASQLADYLYAPANYILINKLIGPNVVALYAPAIQIDSGLLLLVSAIGSVLLPRSALAHAAGATDTLRQYYIRGTLASVVILASAGTLVYLASPVIFRFWLGQPMPLTQSLLPLVLIHTVVGGSSGPARSILLSIGKAKPFALSAIAAGVANVGLGFAFVRYLDWGLSGIVLGTILAVTVRCGIWMPWYVLRSLRQVRQLPSNLEMSVSASLG